MVREQVDPGGQTVTLGGSPSWQDVGVGVGGGVGTHFPKHPPGGHVDIVREHVEPEGQTVTLGGRPS